MKNITKLLIIALLWFLSIWFSFASSKQLFKPENMYKYDLKNLESDLKKDFEPQKCWWIKAANGINCNIFQIKNMLDDKIVTEYIKSLKYKKYKNASNLLNSGYNFGKIVNFPSIWMNWPLEEYWSIAYKDWIIWLELENDSSSIKFYYITIKDNILYKFNSDSYINSKIDWKNKNWVYDSLLSINYSPTDSKSFTIWYKQQICDNCDYLSPIDNSRRLRYLQWKEKSKELDEFQNDFKAKVRKLFK